MKTHSIFFFFNDTATTEIYTLSLHDALPISPPSISPSRSSQVRVGPLGLISSRPSARSEEHTSELHSQFHLVCRLLLEKKNNRCSPPKQHLKDMEDTPGLH